MRENRRWTTSAGNFLHDCQQSVWLGWPGRWLAVLCAVAVVLTGLHWFTPREDRALAAASPAAVAEAASAAFAGTDLASDATLDAEQRSAGIPTDPVAGWDLPTTDGRSVQLVLPGGLGSAEVTPGGQVVYPDRGAGFDVIAENQGMGGRTITRIPQPVSNSKASEPPSLPIVPMFVRTPADTVVLAHTNGMITINHAGPSAPTIATIAAPQARDSAGAMVPSAFLTQQLRPGLYMLAQVIEPGAATAWPVYADPCFSCMVDSAVSGATKLADATISGAKTVGTFVKNNPLESAQIVGGTLLMATGAGTGVGASLVFSGATGLVQKAAAADPTNTALQALGDAMEVAGYISPARSIQKGVTEIAERGVQRIGDDLAANNMGDAVKPKAVTPTPPPQLANDIASVATPKPGTGTPAAPNAPPSGANAAGTPPLSQAGDPPAKLPYYEGPNGPRSLPKGCELDCGDTTTVPVGVYDEGETPGHFNANLDTTAAGKAPEVFDRVGSREAAQNRYEAQKGHPRVGKDGNVLHEWSPASSAQGGEDADIHVLPRAESNVERDIFRSVYNRQGVKVGDQFSTAYRAADGKTRCVRCAIEHRETQRIQQAAVDAARDRAQSVARSGGDAYNGSRLTSQTQVSHNTQDTTAQPGKNKKSNNKKGSAKKDKGEKKKKKKQSTNKKKRKGQR